MSNIKFQMTNQIRSSNVKKYNLALSYSGIHLAFGFWNLEF